MSQQLHSDWFVIVNPSAGNGSVRRRWGKLEPILRATLPGMEVRLTSRRGEAAALAVEGIRLGYRHILAVGGDGTNHEVCNGILGQEIVPSGSITYGLLPVGTGNDWRRTYRIPRRLEAWLDMLRQGHTRLQDAGLVRYHDEEGKPCERFFVNVAGLAYDGFVVRFGDRHRAWVRNKFSYLLLILRCLFLYRLIPARLSFDGQTVEEAFYTINAGIGRFSGGGMQLVPQADPADGLLALTYARSVSKLGVILNTWRFYNGSIGRHPRIFTTQAREIRVEAPPGSPPTLLEADGEFLGQTPVHITIIPQALRVLVPAGQNQALPFSHESPLPG